MPKGQWPPLLLSSLDVERARETLYGGVADGLNGCLEWVAGRRTVQGYGTAEFQALGQPRRVLFVHRVAWVLANDQDIPKEGRICHTCDNPPCVAPAHLFLGTALDNVRDAMAKGRRPAASGLRRNGHAVRWISAENAARGACGRGHPWTPENIMPVLIRGRFPGERCRACAAMPRATRHAKC